MMPLMERGKICIKKHTVFSLHVVDGFFPSSSSSSLSDRVSSPFQPWNRLFSKSDQFYCPYYSDRMRGFCCCWRLCCWHFLSLSLSMFSFFFLFKIHLLAHIEFSFLYRFIFLLIFGRSICECSFFFFLNFIIALAFSALMLCTVHWIRAILVDSQWLWVSAKI